MPTRARTPRKGHDRSKSPSERAAEQRERILDAATQLYSEKGYQNTHIEDIAARAHASRRTMYTHFRDLEALRFAVYERAVSRTFVDLMRVILDESQEDRLAATLRMAFGLLRDNPALSRAVLFEFQRAEPANIVLRKQILGFFASVLMQGTEADYASGACPRRPDELTIIALLGAFEGLVAHFCHSDDSAAHALDAVPVALELYRSVYPYDPTKRAKTKRAK